MKQIIITIEEDGAVSADLTGYHGKGCDKTLADFMGDAKPSLLKHKPEHAEREQQKEKQRG